MGIVIGILAAIFGFMGLAARAVSSRLQSRVITAGFLRIVILL